MKLVMVWDNPNMDRQLSEIFGGGRPPRRPHMIHLLKWLRERAGDDELLACIFANISAVAATNEKFHAYLQMMHDRGFAVFAKHKDQDGQGDIDADMVAYITKHLDDCREVIIASHDAKCFETLIPELLARGITVTVLGYTGLMNGYDRIPGVEMIDLEWVPGVFATPLPREFNIWNIPAEGKLFEPAVQPRRGPRLRRAAAKPENAWRRQKLRDAMSGVKRSRTFVPALAELEPSVKTLGDLVNMTRKDLLAVNGIGKTTADDIIQKLTELGHPLSGG